MSQGKPEVPSDPREVSVGWWIRAITIFLIFLNVTQFVSRTLANILSSCHVFWLGVMNDVLITQVVINWAAVLDDETLFSALACAITGFTLLCQNPQAIGHVVFSTLR